MLVFPVELKNLEDARAGALEAFLGGGVPRGGRGDGAQSRERFVEAGEQRALAVEQGRIGRALMEAKKPVFLERALVQVVAELLMLVEGFRLSHGVEEEVGGEISAVFVGVGLLWRDVRPVAVSKRPATSRLV